MADNKTSIIISAVDQTGAALKSAEAGLAGLGAQAGRVSGILSGFAALAGATAFGGIIKGAIDAADELDDLAQKSGATVESLSAMKGVAKIAGADMEQVAGGLAKLSKNMVEAANGSGDAAKVLTALGVSVTDNAGKMKSTDQVMVEFAKSLQNVGSGTEKVAAAQMVLGKSGAQLLPFLNDLAAAGELQVKVTAEQAAAAANLNDNLNRLSAVHKAWANTVAMEVVPVADVFVKALLETAQGANGTKKAVEDLAKDGTLKAWAQDAAKAAGFVVDSMDGVVRVATAAVLSVKAAVDQTKLFFTGDLKGAQSVGATLYADLDKLAQKELFSETLARRMADLGTTSQAATPGVKSIAAALGDAGEKADKAAQALADLRMETILRNAKEAAKELDTLAKAQEEYAKALYAGTDAIESQAQSAERELRYYGMTESAIQATIIARLEDARAIAAANGAYPEHLAYLDREIDARQRIATASSQKEFLDTNKRAAEASAREWEKFADDLNRSLTDALFRAFESGSGFGKSFADTLGNTLKAALAKAMIQATITTGSNALNTGINALLGTSGSNNGAGTNYLGLANNASSIYNLYSGGQAAYTAYTGTGALSSSEAGAAAWQYLQGGDWGTALGVYLKGLTGTSTTAASSTAAASTTASSSAMGLSTALGYMAVIALAFQALTASKTRYLDTNITGTLGPDGLTNGMISDRYKNTGNLLNAGGSDQIWRPLTGNEAELRDFYARMNGNVSNEELVAGGYLRPYLQLDTPVALDSGMPNAELYQPYTQAERDAAFARYMDALSPMGGQVSPVLGSGTSIAGELEQGAALKTAFEAIYKGARASLQKTADLFGDQTLGKTLENYVSQINIQTSGSLVDAIGGYADALISGMGAAWLPTVESLRATTETAGKKITETWSQTFTRLVNEAGAVNTVFDLLGASLATIYGNNTDKILAASDAFVKLFGSIDAMSASINAYYDNFYTAAEKQDRAWQQIESAMAAIGVTAVPKTREAFRELADSYLKAGDSGAATFKGLMDIQGAFAALVPATQTLSAAVKDAASDAAEAAATWAASVGNSLLAGIDSQQAAAFAAAEAGMVQLQRAVDLERERASAARQAAQEQITLIESLTGYLDDQIAGLIGGTGAGQGAFAAFEFIAQAAANAVAGYLPEQAALAEAVTAARGNLSRTAYASAAERDLATLKLAGQLAQIKDAGAKQLPVAERALGVADEQLKAAEKALDYYRAQIDELRGVRTAAIDLSMGVDAAGKAIVAALGSQLAGLGATIMSALASGKIGSADAAQRLTAAGVPTDTVTLVGGKPTYVSSQGAIATSDGMITANTGARVSIDDARKIVAEAFYAMPAEDFYTAAKKVGLSSSMIDGLYNLPGGTALAWAKSQGLPAFAAGTNRVPADMLAILHKDEAVVPAKYNPALGGGSLADLVGLVDALTGEVRRLQAIVAEGNRHAERTAVVLDDAAKGRNPITTEAAV